MDFDIETEEKQLETEEKKRGVEIARELLGKSEAINAEIKKMKIAAETIFHFGNINGYFLQCADEVRSGGHSDVVTRLETASKKVEQGMKDLLSSTQKMQERNFREVHELYNDSLFRFVEIVYLGQI